MGRNGPEHLPQYPWLHRVAQQLDGQQAANDGARAGRHGGSVEDGHNVRVSHALVGDTKRDVVEVS
ncbi:hypothetical protein ACNI3K_00475 [Demequina sp. SO4-13]|uniref:hypothetical protein n=1 Tax=Demequina sp. SO4-13 TaxID=3401027 RepID=UPI003AF509ED